MKHTHYILVSLLIWTPLIGEAAIERTLRYGMSGTDVRELQVLLNALPQTRIAYEGPGSPGNETTFFGRATEQAVKKYQQHFAAEILHPQNLTTPTGVVGKSTRAHLGRGSSSLGDISFDPETMSIDFDKAIPTAEEIQSRKRALFAKVDDLKKRMTIASAEMRIESLKHSIEMQKTIQQFDYMKEMQLRVSTALQYIQSVVGPEGELLPGAQLRTGVSLDAVTPILLIPGQKATIYGSGLASGQKVYLQNMEIGDTVAQLYGLALEFVVPRNITPGTYALRVAGAPAEQVLSVRVIELQGGTVRP